MTNRKNKQIPPAKKAVSGLKSQSLKEKADLWCGKNRLWIIMSVIILSLVLRIVYYHQCSGTCFIHEHTNQESDMSFFHLGAQKVANGDLLSKTVYHPQHKWMEWVADRYFQSNPDELAQFKTEIGDDTVQRSPTMLLWNHWYGEKNFQQEPLYSYFVAMNYILFGRDVRWVFCFQLLLGVITNVLIFVVTRRYFGDLAAAISGYLAVFCGPLMFYEMVLLRSTLAVFLGILLIWLTGGAIRRNSIVMWIAVGFVAGLTLMVHAFFIFFLAGIIILLPWMFRKTVKVGMRYLIAVILGLLIALLPLIYRNVKVGAPPMALASTSAIGFISMNNADFRSFTGWTINTKYVADIMGESGGNLLRSVIPTLKTHPSAGHYLGMVWDKLHATFSWYEIPNNVNFYLYREYIPVLFLGFITFLVLTPLALTGLFLCLYRRINAWPLYLMLVTYMLPMLVFMVLARYRIIFVPVMIPFAAYTVSELFGRWDGRKNYLLVMALLILGYWAATTGDEKVYRISRNDYAGIWAVHYGTSMKRRIEQQKWDSVAASLSDFLRKYEPGDIASLTPSYRTSDSNEKEIVGFFATMHSNLSVIYSNLKDLPNSEAEHEIGEKLKNIAAR
jgi:hypothetical protein